MFDASTFEAWSVVSWHMLWPIGLHIYCLDISRSSLHGLEAASSPISGVVGSSYVHWDRAVVPTVRRIRGVVLRIPPLIEGFVRIGVSIVSLVVWSVIVSTVS